MPTDSTAVRLTDLRLERGGRAVLDNIDLMVPRGSVTAVLAPSRSGKAELLPGPALQMRPVLQMRFVATFLIGAIIGGVAGQAISLGSEFGFGTAALVAAALTLSMLQGEIPAARAGEPVSYPALGTSLAVGFQPGRGETPYGYLMTRRIERAMALLRGGDLSVTDVCMAVGCTSLGSFSSRFTELVGETPSAYRTRDHEAVAAMPLRRASGEMGAPGV